MKIRVKSKDGVNLWIPAPLSVIKWKIIYSAAAKGKEPDAASSIKAIGNAAGIIYECLKEWKKQNNGEFVLVDVVSAGGDIVKITL